MNGHYLRLLLYYTTFTVQSPNYQRGRNGRYSEVVEARGGMCMFLNYPATTNAIF